MSATQVSANGNRPFSAIMRDLSAAMVQQMFYLGMDAAHPGGNVFEKVGFRKSPSAGLKGTSCYSLPWRGGEIFLHGACSGWFPQGITGGFLFIKPAGRCFIWKGSELPVPGLWPGDLLSPINPENDVPAVSAFLSWLMDHEEMIRNEFGAAYRTACHRKYLSLPKSRPWLAPADGETWLRLFFQDPASASAAKRFPARTASPSPRVSPALEAGNRSPVHGWRFP